MYRLKCRLISWLQIRRRIGIMSAIGQLFFCAYHFWELQSRFHSLFWRRKNFTDYSNVDKYVVEIPRYRVLMIRQKKFLKEAKQNGRHIRRYFFKDIPPFWNCCMNFIGRGSGYCCCRTNSKTLCFISFRWSFMKNSSAQATYLLFEELCLFDIFVYKNCVKLIQNIFFMYFKSLFVKPNKFHTNIYINKL